MAYPAVRKAEKIALSLEIVPTALCVRSALGRIDNWLTSYGLEKECRGNAQLVIAEVLNNIVEHGNLRPEQVIQTTVSLNYAGITCSVRDEAPEFHVLEASRRVDAEPCAASIQLAEGGYGVFLIQTLAQGFRYLDVDHGNHLEFLIPLTTHSEQI